MRIVAGVAVVPCFLGKLLAVVFCAVDFFALEFDEELCLPYAGITAAIRASEQTTPTAALRSSRR